MDKLYKELKPRGVTMSALIAKACGVALASHPRLFASCTADGAGITYNEHINVANAVAMDGGLITPVLKDADTTDIYTLSRTWKDLVKRARSKQLTSDEHSSGAHLQSLHASCVRLPSHSPCMWWTQQCAVASLVCHTCRTGAHPASVACRDLHRVQSGHDGCRDL